MWQYNYTDELYHYGVLGMKWGIRRYQNKDGTLTPAGKKKAAKMKNEYTALTGKQLRRNPTKNKIQNGTSEVSTPKPKKTINDLTDEELRQKIARLRAEKDYMDLSKQIAAMNPKRVSAGKRFVSYVGEKVLKPALTESGKKVLQEFATDRALDFLGVKKKDSDPLADLKAKANKLAFEERIAKSEDYLNARKKNNA